MTYPILITGASGFVGEALCSYLTKHTISFRQATRTTKRDSIQIGDLSAQTNWSAALQGCKAVIHLAARVHVMDDAINDPLDEYRKINVEATLNLAKQAKAYGLKRFVYVSSVKVNGEETKSGYPFTVKDAPAPQDAYGQSKLEAEFALKDFSSASGLELVIVRPPLVYGPGVKANYLRLLQLVSRGIPLPFGSINNLRSMVAVGNLTDLLYLCATHQDAPGNIFFVSDGHDLSTADLIRIMATALGVRPRLLNVPPSLLAGCASVIGKGSQMQRLTSSLQVDISDTCKILKWQPPVDQLTATLEAVKYMRSAPRSD
jgi:nucleoside-diphosphate-sugar epimerase